MIFVPCGSNVDLSYGDLVALRAAHAISSEDGIAALNKWTKSAFRTIRSKAGHHSPGLRASIMIV